MGEREIPDLYLARSKQNFQKKTVIHGLCSNLGGREEVADGACSAQSDG
jgi:hypothetical protein